MQRRRTLLRLALVVPCARMSLHYVARILSHRVMVQPRNILASLQVASSGLPKCCAERHANSAAAMCLKYILYNDV